MLAEARPFRRPPVPLLLLLRPRPRTTWWARWAQQAGAAAAMVQWHGPMAWHYNMVWYGVLRHCMPSRRAGGTLCGRATGWLCVVFYGSWPLLVLINTAAIPPSCPRGALLPWRDSPVSFPPQSGRCWRPDTSRVGQPQWRPDHLCPTSNPSVAPFDFGSKSGWWAFPSQVSCQAVLWQSAGNLSPDGRTVIPKLPQSTPVRRDTVGGAVNPTVQSYPHAPCIHCR